ncbi:nitric oxide reductase activation protein NorD [Amphritea pacifica]|uniref:VWA domain-containing protein n=1 Tax=Amphritea pacifica TaxID=2811233 RepID=A0ABS2WBX5_9GAMM|nr:VWA domain-containing protein [Amphritea pacifica]MBN0989221.1 VWA domain-containing protein [Amphritea pacifica]
MEERVGQIWDRFITRMAHQGHPQAAVALDQVSGQLGVFYRAMGGNSALRISATTATPHRARRSWLHRVAGTGRKVELAWQDENCLYLPASLDLFAEKSLNRDLYFWLAALAGTPLASASPADLSWIVESQLRTCQTLQQYPGLQQRYQRLVQAYIALRPAPADLKHEAAAQERAIQQALISPGSVAELPEGKYAPAPVTLWLHPDAPRSGGQAADEISDRQASQGETRQAEQRRRQAERVDKPDEQGATLGVRHETDLFSFAEFIKMDRSSDDDNPAQAENIANDIDKMSVAQDNTTVASRIKFDLDLPSAQEDDIPLSEGILYPEWDYKKNRLLNDYCRIIPMRSRHAVATELPQHLLKPARRLRRQFESLSLSPQWLRGQYEGDKLNLDAYLEYHGSIANNPSACAADPRLYCQKRPLVRDIASLLLADLSLSTDAWVNDEQQIIDVIRDAVHLFAESLHASGDQFAIHGFSSRRRQHVRFNCIKAFNETYDAGIRGRIADMSPGFYTRMGAAIRHATELLSHQAAEKKLLLILTDGKPNDLDRYEGRHGVEDTRKAIQQARCQGLIPFCITIDDDASQYLPYLFGGQGYTVIRQAEQLPKRLPQLYMTLTGKLCAG